MEMSIFSNGKLIFFFIKGTFSEGKAILCKGHRLGIQHEKISLKNGLKTPQNRRLLRAKKEKSGFRRLRRAKKEKNPGLVKTFPRTPGSLT